MTLVTPIPDTEMIYYVAGMRDVDAWANSRRPAVDTIISLLASAGIDYRSFKSILDFGCGCGRMLAGWEGLVPDDASLSGVDVKADLIEFCQRNIPYAKIWKITPPPPIEAESGAYDFLYAASVFTHMTLDEAHQWAAEVGRIIAHGGIAMITFHGGWFVPAYRDLSPQGVKELEETGFSCHMHAHDTHVGSNDYATFMTAEFFQQLFSADFETLRIYDGATEGPLHIAGYQDVAIVRRK